MKHATIIAASIITVALIACGAMAEPKLELRVEGTVAAGAISTNAITSATAGIDDGVQRGYIGNIQLSYAAAASNVVNVQLVHADTTNTFQPYSVTFASSKYVAGATAGTVPVLNGETLLIDNLLGVGTLTYSVDLLKGSK